MRRGDVVIVRAPDDYASKARPAVVLQSDDFNATHGSFTVCLITSTLSGQSAFRVPVSPEPESGLRRSSEVMVDKLTTVARTRIGQRIGALSSDVMGRIDDALRRWLQL